MKVYRINDLKNLNGREFFIHDSIEELFEDTFGFIKCDYAKKLLFVKQRNFFTDVEIPTKKPEFDGDFRNVERHGKLMHNYILNNLIIKNQDKALLSNMYSNYKIFVYNDGKSDLYFVEISDDELGTEETDSSKFVDITEDFLKELEKFLNPNEIDEFVVKHTKEEIIRKYNREGWEEDWDALYE